MRSLLMATLISMSATASAGTLYTVGSGCMGQVPEDTTIGYSTITNAGTSTQALDCPLESYYRPSSVSGYVYDSSSSSSVSCYVCYHYGSTSYCGSSTSSSSSGTGYSWLTPSWSSSTTSSSTGGFYLGCSVPAGSGISNVTWYQR